MRKLALVGLLFAMFTSCQPDPKTDAIGKDSTVDSAGNPLAKTDTFHVDSGSTTQTYYDCSVLNRQIPSDSSQNQIRRDLAELIHCGIDSFDFLYVVPNLFPGFVSENHVQGNKKVTYNDFVKHVDDFKTSEAYMQLHIRVQTLDSLRTVKFDGGKLYMMKPTLGKLGFTQPEWEMFSGFASTYPIPKKGLFTWGDMLDAFDKYRPQ